MVDGTVSGTVPIDVEVGSVVDTVDGEDGEDVDGAVVGLVVVLSALPIDVDDVVLLDAGATVVVPLLSSPLQAVSAANTTVAATALRTSIRGTLPM